MLNKIRVYVSSSVLGSELRAFRNPVNVKHLRRASSWRSTHRNLMMKSAVGELPNSRMNELVHATSSFD